MTRTCSKCKLALPLNLENFSKRQDSPNGFRLSCRPCYALIKKDWRLKNVEKRQEDNKAWRRNNRGLYRFYKAQYRAAKLKATPKWLSNTHKTEIKKVYELCPDGFQVDHVVPLRGDHVSGLHVPWNLQYLTEADNKRKGNRL